MQKEENTNESRDNIKNDYHTSKLIGCFKVEHMSFIEIRDCFIKSV